MICDKQKKKKDGDSYFRIGMKYECLLDNIFVFIFDCKVKINA